MVNYCKSINLYISTHKTRLKLWLPLPSISFLLQGLLGSLGLLALGGLGGGGLDDTDSNGLPHVTDREPRGWNTMKGSTHMRNLGLSSVDQPSPLSELKTNP